MQPGRLLPVRPVVQLGVRQLPGPTLPVLGDLHVLAVTGSLADYRHHGRHLCSAKVGYYCYERECPYLVVSTSFHTD